MTSRAMSVVGTLSVVTPSTNQIRNDVATRGTHSRPLYGKDRKRDRGKRLIRQLEVMDSVPDACQFKTQNGSASFILMLVDLKVEKLVSAVLPEKKAGLY